MTDKLKAHLPKGSKPSLVVFKTEDNILQWATYTEEETLSSVLPEGASPIFVDGLIGGKTVEAAIQKISVPYELLADGSCAKWDE